MILCTGDGTAVQVTMAAHQCVPYLDHEVGAEERAKNHENDLDDIHEFVMN